jgi:hypothetical protein
MHGCRLRYPRFLGSSPEKPGRGRCQSITRLVEKIDVVSQSLGWLRRSLYFALDKKQFPEKIPNKAEFLGNEHVGVAWFSDTFFLYTRSDQTQSMQQLIQTVGWLLFATMMAESGLRIRGGISFGEAYIDEDESVFVGNPIVEAYQLEKKQQWAGVALTQSAVAKIPERARSGYLADWWVIPYDVPLKEKQTLQTLAVNWTWGGHSFWEASWSRSSEAPLESDWKEHPDICEKFVNTKAFHENVCYNCYKA